MRGCLILFKPRDLLRTLALLVRGKLIRCAIAKALRVGSAVLMRVVGARGLANSMGLG